MLWRVWRDRKKYVKILLSKRQRKREQLVRMDAYKRNHLMVWLKGGSEKVQKSAEKVRITPFQPHHLGKEKFRKVREENFSISRVRGEGGGHIDRSFAQRGVHGVQFPFSIACNHKNKETCLVFRLSCHNKGIRLTFFSSQHAMNMTIKMIT